MLTESLFDEGPPPPCPARFNLAAHALFGDQAGDKTALTLAGAEGEALRCWSYDELREAVARAAGGLIAAGLEPGAPVLLRLGHVAEFPILFLGAVAAGGIAAPISPMLVDAEAAAIARRLRARLICAGEGLGLEIEGATTLGPERIAALLRARPAGIAATGADDPAFIVHSSGSAGRPKGVLHAHRAAWARRMMWQGWYGLDRDDVMLHAGAFNWTYTLGAGLLDPWACGAATVIRQGPPDPGLWARLAERHGATIFAAAPGVYRRLLKYGERLGEGFAGLRHGLSAGEALDPTIAAAWRAATGREVHEALGMSEVSTYVSGSPARPASPGRVGRPQPGRRVAVLRSGTDRPAPVGETGELAVSRRDPGLMLGYWDAPEETEAAFRGEWFVTGDLAAMDASGEIAFRGRGDDQINAGGHRVQPEEVEAALAAHPQVAEAAAVELPLGPGLSILAAFAVAPGADPEALRAWCAARLAAYKTPRRITLVEALPRTATGKLSRRALIEAHREG